MSKRQATKGKGAKGQRILRHREDYDLRDIHPYVESQNSEEEVIEDQPKVRGRKRKAESTISDDLPKKRTKRAKKEERERGEDSRERETLIKRGLKSDHKGEKEKIPGYLRDNKFKGSYADRLRRGRTHEEGEPRRGRTLRRKKSPRVTIPKRLLEAARKQKQLKPIEEPASTNSSMEDLSEREHLTPLQKVFADYNKEWWQESHIDIYYDDPDAIEIKAYYPGVPREDLAIELEPLADKKLLTLTAVKIRDKEKIDQGDDVPYYFVERSYGSFVRSIPVPLSVDASQISATYNIREGYLHVVIPRPREVSNKSKSKIEIKEHEHEQHPSITRVVNEAFKYAGANAQSTGFMAAAKAGSTEAGAGSTSAPPESDAAPLAGVASEGSGPELNDPENVRKAKELSDAPLATTGFAEES